MALCITVARLRACLRSPVPNRRNPSHPDMIFRVRVAGLKSKSSYYYTVESTGATGVNDGASSPVRTFKTK